MRVRATHIFMNRLDIYSITSVLIHGEYRKTEDSRKLLFNNMKIMTFYWWPLHSPRMWGLKEVLFDGLIVSQVLHSPRVWGFPGRSDSSWAVMTFISFVNSPPELALTKVNLLWLLVVRDSSSWSNQRKVDLIKTWEPASNVPCRLQNTTVGW